MLQEKCHLPQDRWVLVGDALGKGMVKLLTQPKDRPEPPKPASHTLKPIEGCRKVLF